MPKGASNHTCSVVIMINSAVKKCENYYPLVFLNECKYIEKEMIRYITEVLEVSSDGSDESTEE